MGTIGKSLRETVKKLAYSTSVDQLKKRGVNNVRVVGLDRIVALMEEAVHRSLRHKLMGLDRAQIAGETTEEFLRLLKSNKELVRSRDEALKQKQAVEGELDTMRRELEEQKQALRERLAEGELDFRAQHEGENVEIAMRVQELFTELANSDSADLPTLREQTLALVMDLVGNQRKATMEAHTAAQDSEVERLQRRIAKLTSSLATTEKKLVQVASLKDVDPGISSIYRDVQGLDEGDGHVERKRELMSDLFKANLALQKGETEAAPS
ncbi:MAG: hypothetical protein AAF628_01710 [Planctomycetota bacterium]